ncbi:hypothetical protein HELRODRAFT_175833 [Helobdella robusta]|uniref:Uncharacterized protein n=1 Tax=Helobdella robusta TaxID=6412 RepID=T1F9Q8_HELRO|nr:hypothetical protein HELRODRAFT_175833 [Helobdella robusta]ESO00413.1 hypothetical protein HELRODRAFT_175833 [Helobdella robusta]
MSNFSEINKLKRNMKNLKGSLKYRDRIQIGDSGGFKKVQRRNNWVKHEEKVPRVVIGFHSASDSKIKENKPIVFKIFFHISNVRNCSASDVTEHLKKIGIETSSCYSLFKRKDEKAELNHDNLSTSYRLCVHQRYSSLVNSEDIWPEYVRIRDWLFNNNHNNNNGHDMKPTTMSDN